MTKTRIGERLSKVTAGEAPAPTRKSRSGELDHFNTKFDEFSKMFKHLVTVLKNHHAQLQKAEKSQGEVIEELQKYIKTTPVETPGTNPVKVQIDLLKRDKVYSDKYVKEILDYVHEWDLVVKSRVEAARKQVKEFKHDLDHYEKKMVSLTKDHEATLAKGKSPAPNAIERLKRNEEKLALAKDSYEHQTNRLVDLLEEIVVGAWKDVLPMLLHMMNMERNILDEQKSILDSSNVIQNLKNLAEAYDIDITTPPPGPVEKTPVPSEAKKETKDKDKDAKEAAKSVPPEDKKESAKPVPPEEKKEAEEPVPPEDTLEDVKPVPPPVKDTKKVAPVLHDV